jgi:tetratricopeptide (TPR) repeat protein
VYRSIGNAEKLTGDERYSRVMAAALHSAALHESFTQFDEAVGDFRLAEIAAVKLGNRDAQVNAIYGQAYVLFLAKRLPEVREQGARALQLAQAAGSVAGVASSNVISGLEPFCTGDLAAARQRFEQAIPVLRQRGPFKHCVDAVCFRGTLANQRLDHEQANEDLGWAYEKAREAGLTFDLLIALFHRARTRANQGRLFEASEMLKEAQRLAELLGDRFWRPRIENTQAWLLTELFDTEAALRLNTEAVQASHDFGDVEAECMSRINAARDYLVLGEPQQAWEHLRQAEALYEQDVWFRWIYYPRLQAELASYWISRGDLVQALSHAQESLEQASRTQSRKRMAWARRLLGDIALLEHRLADALGEYDNGLQLLEHHPCPMVEWRILQAAAGAANMLGDSAGHSVLLAHARAVVQMLADSARDDTLRRTFLRSRPIRELLS